MDLLGLQASKHRAVHQAAVLAFEEPTALALDVFFSGDATSGSRWRKGLVSGNKAWLRGFVAPCQTVPLEQFAKGTP
jgi:hypothetical protein